MLDEVEFAEVNGLYRTALEQVKNFRRETGTPLGSLNRRWVDDVYKPLLDAYERITGIRETNPLAVMHHRIDLYGPPCRVCGRPLRTPKAKMCVSCGATR
jgi:hypothetical protein